MEDQKPRQSILTNVLPWLTIAVLSVGIIVAGLIASQLPKHKQQLVHQPLVQRACQYIDCAFLTSPKRLIDWEKLTLINTAVYLGAGGYSLRFVVRNQASHPQPLPALLLNSFAADGALLAQRKISVSQYRVSSEVEAADVIKAQTSQSFVLSLGGLPNEAVRYSLDIAKE